MQNQANHPTRAMIVFNPTAGQAGSLEHDILIARDLWREHGWEDAADGMAAITSITRVHQLMMARIDASLKPHGVSFARFEMLRLLAFAHGGRLPMSRARSVLQVHPASVTNVVDRLEADGLVRREAHPDDRRARIVVATESAREAAPAAYAIAEALYD